MDKFRYDINVLRAFAVLTVVLFHFEIIGFKSGFVGVDVFFVISGYLMSKIIISQLIHDNFSFSKFYLARAIRIIPLLLIVCLIIGIISVCFLPPEELIDYSKHAISSVLFYSNFIYTLEANNYFAADTHSKLLLHTWSLSNEWQFYIIFPIILWFIKLINNTKKTYFFIMCVGFIFSLLLSIFIPEKYNVFSFYMIPTRAWEMLLGGIVYLISDFLMSKFRLNILFFIGWLLLLISLITSNVSSSWPSIYTLIPTIGTSFVILSNMNSGFMKNKILNFFGNISYSLYLWHWPIVFYMNYFLLNDYLYKVFFIALSIILSFFSYTYFENPVRKILNSKKTIRSYSIVFVSCFIVIFINIIVVYQDGLIQRSSKEFKYISKIMVMPSIANGWCFYDVNNPNILVSEKGVICKVGDLSSQKNALLIGDSYAGHNIPFWNTLGKKLKVNINTTTTNWCYPSFDKNFPGPKNSKAYQQCLITREFIANNWKNYDIIILAGQWQAIFNDDNYRKSFGKMLNILKKSNKKIILMDIPYIYKKDLGKIYKRYIFLKRKFDVKLYLNSNFISDQSSIHSKLINLTKNNKNIIFLDKKYLYDSSHIAKKNIPYTLDGGHISIIGSLESANYFIKTIKYHELELFIYN